jgi:hypothetical protein
MTHGQCLVEILGAEMLMHRPELRDHFTHILETTMRTVLVGHLMFLVPPFNKELQVFTWDVLGCLQ